MLLLWQNWYLWIFIALWRLDYSQVFLKSFCSRFLNSLKCYSSNIWVRSRAHIFISECSVVVFWFPPWLRLWHEISFAFLFISLFNFIRNRGTFFRCAILSIVLVLCFAAAWHLCRLYLSGHGSILIELFTVDIYACDRFFRLVMLLFGYD